MKSKRINKIPYDKTEVARIRREHLEHKHEQHEAKQKAEGIPDDWESLPFFRQRQIARQYYDGSIRTKKQAAEIIHAVKR